MENKETEIDIIELLKGIWAQKKKVVKWGLWGAVAGVIIAFSIPKQYETVVKIAPESKSTAGLGGSMGGLAALAGVDLEGKSVDGISSKIYPEILSSAPFLLELADIKVSDKGKEMSFFEYITKEQRSAWWSYVISAPMKAVGLVMGLFSDDKESRDRPLSLYEPTQEQLDYMGALRKMIVMTEDKKLGIFTIKTTMQDPKIAAIIADSLLSDLQSYMVDYKTAKARGDLDANLERLKDAKAKYYRADSLYASVMDKNQNLISQSAKMKIERLLEEKELAYSIYEQLSSQVEVSRMSLQENTPIATVIEPPSVPVRASSPKKAMLLIAFVFLGGLVASANVVVRQLVGKSDRP